MLTETNQPCAQAAMFVLDVLHDVESLELIVELLNDGELGWIDRWRRPFEKDDVMCAIEWLLEREFIEVFEEHSEKQRLVPILPTTAEIQTHERLWFGQTPSGRDAWEKWSPNDD